MYIIFYFSLSKKKSFRIFFPFFRPFTTKFTLALNLWIRWNVLLNDVKLHIVRRMKTFLMYSKGYCHAVESKMKALSLRRRTMSFWHMAFLSLFWTVEVNFKKNNNNNLQQTLSFSLLYKKYMLILSFDVSLFIQAESSFIYFLVSLWWTWNIFLIFHPYLSHNEVIITILILLT